jgi:hypothetical protein
MSKTKKQMIYGKYGILDIGVVDIEFEQFLGIDVDPELSQKKYQKDYDRQWNALEKRLNDITVIKLKKIYKKALDSKWQTKLRWEERDRKLGLI